MLIQKTHFTENLWNNLIRLDIELLENKYLLEFYVNKISINRIFKNKKKASNKINYFTIDKINLKKTIMVQTNAIMLENN